MISFRFSFIDIFVIEECYSEYEICWDFDGDLLKYRNFLTKLGFFCRCHKIPVFQQTPIKIPILPLLKSAEICSICWISEENKSNCFIWAIKSIFFRICFSVRQIYLTKINYTIYSKYLLKWLAISKIQNKK